MDRLYPIALREWTDGEGNQCWTFDVDGEGNQCWTFDVAGRPMALPLVIATIAKQ